MLRVNTGIKPNAAGACVFGVADGGTPSRLGAIDGDLCGFPNGRRLLDDVTDIELRALVEGYGPTLNAVLGVPNRTPNNLLGDGVDANDAPVPDGLPVHRDCRTRATRTSTSTATELASPSRLRQPGHRPGCRDSGRVWSVWFRSFRGARRKRISTFGSFRGRTIGYGGRAAGISAATSALGSQAWRRDTQGDRMSRTRILAAGGLLWTVAVVDGLAHVVSGDLLAPALMAVLGIAGVGLIAAAAVDGALSRRRLSSSRRAAAGRHIESVTRLADSIRPRAARPESACPLA